MANAPPNGRSSRQRGCDSPLNPSSMTQSLSSNDLLDCLSLMDADHTAAEGVSMTGHLHAEETWSVDTDSGSSGPLSQLERWELLELRTRCQLLERKNQELESRLEYLYRFVLQLQAGSRLPMFQVMGPDSGQQRERTVPHQTTGFSQGSDITSTQYVTGPALSKGDGKVNALPKSSILRNRIQKIKRSMNLLNSGDIDAFFDMVEGYHAEECVLNNPDLPEPITGKKNVLDYWRRLLDFFPDATVEITAIYGDESEDDAVQAQWMVKGTPSKAVPQMSFVPTGAPLSVIGYSKFWFAKSDLVYQEVWNWNHLGVLSSVLGVTPSLMPRVSLILGSCPVTRY